MDVYDGLQGARPLIDESCLVSAGLIDESQEIREIEIDCPGMIQFVVVCGTFLGAATDRPDWVNMEVNTGDFNHQNEPAIK